MDTGTGTRPPLLLNDLGSTGTWSISYPVIVVGVVKPGSTGDEADVHFLQCTSGCITNDVKRFTPLGINFILKLRPEENANGRARYWLENGKRLSKATKVRVDHTFVLPFGRFRNFDDTESALDYRLDPDSYDRLLARRELSATEIHLFAPTALLRHGRLHTLQGPNAGPSSSSDYGGANGDGTHGHHTEGRLLEQAHESKNDHFVEEHEDSSDSDDTYFEAECESSSSNELPLRRIPPVPATLTLTAPATNAQGRRESNDQSLIAGKF
ncbi:uncharacterized protein PAC_09387 [Phialocephala subalpina]|uniref:Uncharacterized protein n=1 Tax=Phialocephala subalpina TaxID=576137 RepID=A0A1L7X399_9HELO|nr:uncharacterized protein PAC_09387 [Phialocephala subalpina]